MQLWTPAPIFALGHWLPHSQESLVKCSVCGTLVQTTRGRAIKHLKPEIVEVAADADTAETSLKTVSPTVGLRELAELYTSGVLTNEEFESKKKEILHRI